MNKLVKFSTLMLFAALIFAGCKKDEPANYADDIVGVYVGQLMVTASGVTSNVDNATLVVTRVANDKVNIKADMTSFGVGEVNCEAKVTKSGNDYNVEGTSEVLTFSVVISGNISENGNAIININVATDTTPAIQMASAIFTGQRQ
ncbi:MAG: hypothetical protein FWF72_05640 [Paludibacter sp.]|nr:hypothetical protein [Paludibacter sp.]